MFTAVRPVVVLLYLDLAVVRWPGMCSHFFFRVWELIKVVITI